MGFLNLNDIYLKAAKVFSADYIEAIYMGMNTSGNVRYYEETEYIMVNSKAEPFLNDEVKYLYDTLTVIDGDKDEVCVKITVKVTRGEDTQTREKEIELVKEDGKWLINSPTYITYRPSSAEK